MPVLVPNGFAQITLPLQHVSGAHVGAIVFGVEYINGLTDGVALCDKMVTDYDSTLGVLTDAGVLIGPAIARVGVGSGEPVSFVGTSQGQGNKTAEMLPSNCALLVKKTTFTGGRRGRGRAYLPWVIEETWCDDVGNIFSTNQATLQGAVDDWKGELETGAGALDPTPMYLLHNSEGETPAGSPSEVVSLTVDSLIATQRRRLGR